MLNEIDRFDAWESANVVLGTGEIVPVRVMAMAEGWAMVRRKGATPFVVRAGELFKPESESESPTS